MRRQATETGGAILSTSPEDRLRNQVFELAEACLQGSATARQMAQLEELLQDDQRARKHYLEFIQDSYSLRIWALAELERREAETDLPDPSATDQHDPLSSDSLPPASKFANRASVQRRGSRPRRRSQRVLTTLMVVASVAAIVLIALRVVPELDTNDLLGNQPVVASMVDAQECVWIGGRQFNSGTPITQGQQLQLSTGTARIRFQDGATVTLQGPANLELLSAGSARLQSGVLTSFVPPAAVGFQVQTEALDVIDLGTSFGVAVTDDGKTSVSVFSGRVEVTRPDADESTARILSQGESVVATTQQSSIEPIDFTAEQFEQPLRAANGVVSTDGECRFLAEQAVGGMLPSDNEQILVALERRDLLLPRELVADFVPKPDGDGIAQGKVAPIPAGTRVDCFLVQFCPNADAIPRKGASATGRITFDRPILGLISRNANLTRTDKLFAGGKTDFEQTLRGGETGDNARERDTLVMSDDRRTIEITANLRKNMDQARVLVRATDQQWSPTAQPKNRNTKE